MALVPDHELGPIRFVLRPTWSDKAALWLLTGVFLATPAFLGAAGLAKRKPLAAVICGLLGIAALLPALHRQSAALWCHDRGLRRSSWIGLSRELSFAAVGRLTYAPPRVTSGVVLIGSIPIPYRTTHAGKIRLDPAPGEFGEPISWPVVRLDGRIDELREAVARLVARRMERELRERGE